MKVSLAQAQIGTVQVAHHYYFTGEAQLSLCWCSASAKKTVCRDLRRIISDICQEVHSLNRREVECPKPVAMLSRSHIRVDVCQAPKAPHLTCITIFSGLGTIATFCKCILRVTGRCFYYPNTHFATQQPARVMQWCFKDVGHVEMTIVGFFGDMTSSIGRYRCDDSCYR